MSTHNICLHGEFFLFLHANIFSGYSLGAPYQGASNENPQHRFAWRNKKKIFKGSTRIQSYVETFLRINSVWSQNKVMIDQSDLSL